MPARSPADTTATTRTIVRRPMSFVSYAHASRRGPVSAQHPDQLRGRREPPRSAPTSSAASGCSAASRFRVPIVVPALWIPRTTRNTNGQTDPAAECELGSPIRFDPYGLECCYTNCGSDISAPGLMVGAVVRILRVGVVVGSHDAGTTS